MTILLKEEVNFITKNFIKVNLWKKLQQSLMPIQHRLLQKALRKISKSFQNFTFHVKQLCNNSERIMQYFILKCCNKNIFEAFTYNKFENFQVTRE